MSMTIPLRIDSKLVHRARSAGMLADRTPTAQIEHWAKLGIALEPVLSGGSIARVRALIQQHGDPVYEADPEDPTLVVERRPDGTYRRGRFENRQFRPVGRKQGKTGATS